VKIFLKVLGATFYFFETPCTRVAHGSKFCDPTRERRDLTRPAKIHEFLDPTRPDPQAYL